MAKIKLPTDFDGAKFAEKHDLDPRAGFYVDNGFLILPGMDELTANDLANCIIDEPTDTEKQKVAELAAGITLETKINALIARERGDDMALKKLKSELDTIDAELSK